MGNKGGKKASNSDSTTKDSRQINSLEPGNLSSNDYKFLIDQTTLKKEDIDSIFRKFSEKNPDNKLDRQEFIRLYSELRYEPADKLDEISHFIFNTFDQDKNGFIAFNEFMVKNIVY